MAIIIFYLIGYIVSFFLGRYFIRKEEGDNYDLSDARFNLRSSLLSWVSVLSWLFMLILYIIEKQNRNKPKKSGKKPPKWM